MYNMDKYSNSTTVTEFFLTGFPGVSPEFYPAVGLLLLFIYLVLALGNIFTIAFVFYEKNLQKPVYLIFCNLAAVDFAFGTATMPKIVGKYLISDDNISFYACFIQMYLIHYLGTVTSFLLLVMAIDRFIAICNPLRYPTIVTNQSAAVICLIFWIFPGLWMVLIVYQSISLPYCNSNIIQHCFCDRTSITKLACSDITVPQTYAFVGAMVTLLGPLAFILSSYVSIIIAVFKISNAQGKYKTFSTCSPQLLIICLYYLPRCAVYVLDVTVQMKIDARIMIVIWYSLFPPLVNPMIFCFRTKEIREAFLMKLRKSKISHKRTAPSG
ncbi:olfactory receptor 2AT4-like [Astyanax mexicanus]|uniref:olfactory receptor 2AT4-like n=1 Tax=Astyanax mexicanus TaxID=7994 RepID=UPI0020CB5D7D|nr:olfactory receptor 2AT4-like [Astyanax mexicanus]